MAIKIKDGFVVRQISDIWVAVPTAERTEDVSGLIKLSDGGAFLWANMVNWTTVKELLKKMTDEFEVDDETAKRDIAAFIASLRDKKLLEG